MNAKNNRVVTNGEWCVSTTSGTGIDGCILNVHQSVAGSHFKDGQFRMRRASLDGMTFPKRHDDAYQSLCLQHGFLKLYGRNTCVFVMSRAARRRGFTTTDWQYVGRAERWSRERA